MSTIYTKRPISSLDIYNCPDDRRIEFVDTELLVRDMSVEPSWIAGKILRIVGDFAEGNGIGRIFGADLGCQCFEDAPHLVRKPDVTFVRSDRFPVDQIGEGYLRIVPDLVVEVVSPNDSYDDVDGKTESFLGANVPLIWIVSPATRSIHVYRSDGTISILREGDELSGEGIIPGFACPVASIFPPRPGPTA